MNSRIVLIGGATAAVGLLVALLTVGSSVAQAPQAAAAIRIEHTSLGRYALIPTANGGIYLNDTATGECWRLNAETQWSRIAPPKTP